MNTQSFSIVFLRGLSLKWSLKHLISCREMSIILTTLHGPLTIQFPSFSDTDYDAYAAMIWSTTVIMTVMCMCVHARILWTYVCVS